MGEAVALHQAPDIGLATHANRGYRPRRSADAAGPAIAAARARRYDPPSRSPSPAPSAIEVVMFGRRSLVASLAAVLTLSLGACASAPPEAAVDRAALRDQLMVLEVKSWKDTQDRNVSAMNAFLGDDAVLIFADGTRFSKREFLATLADLNTVSVTVDRNAELIVSNPDAAIVIYKVAYTGGMKSAPPTSVTALATSSYVRRDGRWVSVLYQETLLR